MQHAVLPARKNIANLQIPHRAAATLRRRLREPNDAAAGACYYGQRKMIARNDGRADRGQRPGEECGMGPEERMRPGVLKEYGNQRIVVAWEPAYCIHAENCIKTAPEVFDAGRRPWIVV